MVDRRATVEAIMVILEQLLDDPTFMAEEYGVAGYSFIEIQGMLRTLNELYSEMDDEND